MLVNVSVAECSSSASGCAWPIIDNNVHSKGSPFSIYRYTPFRFVSTEPRFTFFEPLYSRSHLPLCACLLRLSRAFFLRFPSPSLFTSQSFSLSFIALPTRLFMPCPSNFIQFYPAPTLPFVLYVVPVYWYSFFLLLFFFA